MTKLIKIVIPSQRSQTSTEVNRWSIKEEWSEKIWDELMTKLQKLFRTRQTKFFVSWFGELFSVLSFGDKASFISPGKVAYL